MDPSNNHHRFQDPLQMLTDQTGSSSRRMLLYTVFVKPRLIALISLLIVFNYFFLFCEYFSLLSFTVHKYVHIYYIVVFLEIF